MAQISIEDINTARQMRHASNNSCVKFGWHKSARSIAPVPFLDHPCKGWPLNYFCNFALAPPLLHICHEGFLLAEEYLAWQNTLHRDISQTLLQSRPDHDATGLSRSVRPCGRSDSTRWKNQVGRGRCPDLYRAVSEGWRTGCRARLSEANLFTSQRTSCMAETPIRP